MNITIDPNSGYCFGVEFAIQMAETELNDSETLYCLGDIVHNDMEVNRLNKKGLIVIDKEELKNLKDCKVLIRAHGEPPETYEMAMQNNIELVDASCPVVLKLQNRIKNAYDKQKYKDGQIVIYGKEGHAEVIGLTGQTGNQAIIVTSIEDLDKIDFNKPVTLFSQTTKSTKGFYAIKEEIEKRISATNQSNLLDSNDSICRQVSNREPQLERFSQEHEVIIFVSGKKSSNGKALFEVCKKNNSDSYFVENAEEIDSSWLKNKNSVGICGATSTPMWLMEEVATYIKSFENEPIIQ